MEVGTLAQWAAASATFLAVLVALFKDEILRWWRKPKLTVSITLQPPFKIVESFLPMNLRWSHGQQGSRAPEIFADGISPEMGKHCDLGRVVDPKHHANLGEELPSAQAGEAVLALDLEVPPNTKSHLIPPGVYQLQLLVAAANCAPVKKVIELTITGKWFADQTQMFSDGLGIKVIN